MSEYDAVRRLWDLGHFFAPEAMAFGRVEEGDLPALSLRERVCQAALSSYRRWTLPPGQAEPDSVFGLLALPRCGVPDYRDPRQRLPEAANWPLACRGDITTSYRMALSGLTPEQLAALWQEADGNWQQVLEVGFDFRLDLYPNTRIYAFAARLPGNTLADQYLATGDCGARLQGRVDSDRAWDEVLLVTTLAHEHGHALGINHLPDAQALMYPSITQASLARRGAPGQADVEAALRLGYRRRQTPAPEPEPEPPGAAEVVIPKAGRWRWVAEE